MEHLTRRNFLGRATAVGLVFMFGLKTKPVDLSSCYGTGNYGTAVYGGQRLHHH